MAQMESREERENTSLPPHRIIRGRLGAVAAAIAALASLSSTSKPSHDAVPEPLDHISAASRNNARLLSAKNTFSPAPDDEVTDFRVDNGRFTCRFGDLPIEGIIAEDGTVPEVRLDGRTFTLSQPVSPQTLARFLRSAAATSALLHASGLTPQNGTMEAIGGARFLFTTGTEGHAQPRMATVRDVFTIDPAEEMERRAAETQWKDALRHCAEFSQAQNDTIDARIDVHNGRMRAIYDDLSRRMERDNWYYWQQRRTEFSHGWNAITHEWRKASTDEKGTLLPRFHTYLADWEQLLSLTPDMEAEEAFRARYDGIVQDLTTTRGEEERLRDRAHTRTLRDSARDITITEKSSVLSAKNFTLEALRAGVLSVRETYEDDVLTQKTEYDQAGNVVKETHAQYFPGGQLRRAQEYAPKDGKSALQRQTDYWKNGNARAVLDVRSDAFAYFGENGTLLYEDVARSDRAKRERGMVDAQGNRFGLYSDEKAKNPSLTPSQYLDMLARKLDTEEKLAVFFEQFLWYANDHWDEWQTAEETVQRVEENGQSGAHYMRGDCDDYAFLAREILRRQGKNAHVVGIPQHAICVWVEVDHAGRYHARCLDTFGFDVNGNRYGAQYLRDRVKALGYAQLIDALNSIVTKYQYPGLGVPEGQNYTFDPQNITILPNPPAGNYQRVTAEHFLEKVG